MAGERDISSRIQSGVHERLELEGKPYFLMESYAPEIFYVAKAIVLDRDGWWGEKDNSLGELVLERHIIETPARDLHLLVKRNSKEHYEVELDRIINVLKRLAEVSNHDYVSYVPHANGISETIFSRDGELLKVTPRLFKRK